MWVRLLPEAYLELCQTSKMELFVKSLNGWQGSKYTSNLTLVIQILPRGIQMSFVVKIKIFKFYANRTH